MIRIHRPQEGIGAAIGRRLAQRRLDLLRKGGTIVDNSADLVYLDELPIQKEENS
jgi:hypothetical protein